MTVKHEVELPPIVPLNCSNPVPAREWASLEYKYIGELVDQLEEMDLPPRAYDRIDRLWESVDILYHILKTKVGTWKDDEENVNGEEER